MPRWKELKKYLDNNGWQLYRNSDHYYYKKIGKNGEYMLCKVSKGSGEIEKGLWKSILKHELRITQEEFNKGKH